MNDKKLYDGYFHQLQTQVKAAGLILMTQQANRASFIFKILSQTNISSSQDNKEILGRKGHLLSGSIFFASTEENTTHTGHRKDSLKCLSLEIDTTCSAWASWPVNWFCYDSFS